MPFLLAVLALLGHAYLWAAVFNLTHSVAMPRRALGASTALGFACAMLIPVAFWLWYGWGGVTAADHHVRTILAWPGRLYLGACWMAAGVTVARWVKRRAFGRTPAVLRHNRSRLVDLARASGRSSSADLDHPFVAKLPGNQVLQLEIAERALEVPRLPAPLDRLTIVHLSDLHFTGRIGRAYFDEVVRLSNQLEPDLVAVTGDLVDRRECIGWIPETLGKLTSRCGAYFVLGNHDLRLDAPASAKRCSTAGWSIWGAGGRRSASAASG